MDFCTFAKDIKMIANAIKHIRINADDIDAARCYMSFISLLWNEDFDLKSSVREAAPEPVI